MNINIILLSAVVLAFAGCDTKKYEAKVATLENELAAVKSELKRAKSKSSLAIKQNNVEDAVSTELPYPPTPSQPHAPASLLAVKTTHLYEVSAAYSGIIPCINRAIKAGVNDPYFQSEAAKVAAQMSALALKGDALKAAWQQSGEVNTDVKIQGIVELQILLKELEAQARNAPTLSYEEKEKAKVNSLTEHGIENVPDEVMTKIVERVKRTSDDSIMEYSIKAEARDYLKIEVFRQSNEMTKEAREQLLARAERKNPESWSMMWNDLNQQLESYRTITRWEKEGIPGVDKEQSLNIIKAAKTAYPNDWSMMVYEINQSADSKQQ